MYVGGCPAPPSSLLLRRRSSSHHRGQRFANFLFGILSAVFGGIPTYLPLDAVLVVHRHEGSRRFLVGARRHSIKWQDKLINAPKALTPVQRPLCAVGKAGFVVENFDILGRFIYSRLVRRSLLRRLLFVHFFVRQIVGR